MKITLCGSTKFKNEFDLVNADLTLKGHIVYSVSCFGHTTGIPRLNGPPSYSKPTEKEKITLDLVHLIKIMESDGILIINVNNYIGESTAREMQWAQLLDKEISYLTDLYPELSND